MFEERDQVEQSRAAQTGETAEAEDDGTLVLAGDADSREGDENQYEDDNELDEIHADSVLR